MVDKEKKDLAKENQDQVLDQVDRDLDQGTETKTDLDVELTDQAKEEDQEFEADIEPSQESPEETKEDLETDQAGSEKLEQRVNSDDSKADKDQVPHEKKSQETMDDDSQGTLYTVFSVVSNVVFSLFLIIILGIFTLNTISYFKGDDISIFNRTMYIVGENTMQPFMKENDAIIVEKKKAHEVQDGDLIVYETTDGEKVTGWVTNLLDEQRFEIKKNVNSDESIVIDGIAIIGVGTLKIANMGDFIEFISSPISLVIVLAVGIVIYLGLWILTNRNTKAYK